MSTTATARERERTEQPDDTRGHTNRARPGRGDPWYSSYPVIGVVAQDDGDAARKLREAETAIQAIDGITLLDGDLFEETYRRGNDGEDVQVHLELPDA